MTRTKLIALALLAGTLTTCGGETQRPPAAGWLDVRLASPNSSDGGVLFTVSGAAIDSVRSPSVAEFFARQQGPSSWRVLAVGNIGPGVVAQIWVPDLSALDSYAAEVTEAAARDTFEQRDVTGYELTVRRQL